MGFDYHSEGSAFLVDNVEVFEDIAENFDGQVIDTDSIGWSWLWVWILPDLQQESAKIADGKNWREQLNIPHVS